MRAQSSSGSVCVWERVVAGSSLSYVYRRVELVCAGGDRRRTVACVTWCAEVRSFPARPMKSGRVPTDDVNFQQLLV